MTYSPVQVVMPSLTSTWISLFSFAIKKPSRFRCMSTCVTLTEYVLPPSTKVAFVFVFDVNTTPFFSAVACTLEESM